MNGFYFLMVRFMCYVDCLETLMSFGMSRMLKHTLDKDKMTLLRKHHLIACMYDAYKSSLLSPFPLICVELHRHFICDMVTLKKFS